jgi:hypothetical protein
MATLRRSKVSLQLIPALKTVASGRPFFYDSQKGGHETLIHGRS